MDRLGFMIPKTRELGRTDFDDLTEGDYTPLTRIFNYSKQTMSDEPLRLATESSNHIILLKNEKEYHTFFEDDKYVEHFLDTAQKNCITLTIRDDRKPDGVAFDFNSDASMVFFSRVDSHQAYLLPGIDYTIVEKPQTHDDLHGADVLLSFDDPSDKRRRLLAFTLFTSQRVPNLKRFYEYISSRKDIPLRVTKPIASVVETNNLNTLFSHFHSMMEAPIMEQKEVYVLDDVSRSGYNKVNLSFHKYSFDASFISNDAFEQNFIHILSNRGTVRSDMEIAIKTFTNASDAPEAFGRRQDDIYSFFKGRLDKGMRLFRPIDDLYNNSLDFMIDPNSNFTTPHAIKFRMYSSDAGITRDNAEALGRESFDMKYNIRIVGSGKDQYLINPSTVP